MSDRENVRCSFCGAEPQKACDFNGEPAPEVTENGVKRRAVHAARYAMSLPENERQAFWGSAVDRYLSTELGLMGQ